MRIRTIKPQFFMNEELALLDKAGLARLAFIGLWCAADCEGRLEDRPNRLKHEILPYDDVDMDKVLSLLEQGNFIRRYEVDGKKLISVTTFRDHQRITGTEASAASKYPPPNGVVVHAKKHRVRIDNTGVKPGAAENQFHKDVKDGKINLDGTPIPQPT